MSERLFFREAIARAVGTAMADDPRVILLGQDVGAFGGSYREFAGLFDRFGAARVRDMPVAELAMVGLAAGAAAAGLRPLVSITYMDFVMLALDPLVNYAAKAQWKTGGQIRVPMVLKLTAGAKGQGVAHSQSLEAWLMSVPGLTIVAPSDVEDAHGLMRSALLADGPVIYVDHKRLFPTAGILHDPAPVPFGVARLRRAGGHLTITAHGYSVGLAMQAAEALSAQGVQADVLDLRTLRPLDTAAIVASVRRTGALLTVEEGQATCGVGAEIAAQVYTALGPVRTARVAAAPIPISSNPVLEAACLPTPATIAAAALTLLEHRP